MIEPVLNPKKDFPVFGANKEEAFVPNKEEVFVGIVNVKGVLVAPGPLKPFEVNIFSALMLGFDIISNIFTELEGPTPLVGGANKVDVFGGSFTFTGLYATPGPL